MRAQHHKWFHCESNRKFIQIEAYLPRGAGRMMTTAMDYGSAQSQIVLLLTYELTKLHSMWLYSVRDIKEWMVRRCHTANKMSLFVSSAWAGSDKSLPIHIV